MDFPTILNQLIQLEGGYTNNPADPGGETNYGITKAVAVNNGYTAPMISMPLSVAQTIYTKLYWTAPNFSSVANVNFSIAQVLFQSGVNIGPGTVSKFVQRALNVLNYNGAWPTLTVDGGLGQISINALQTFLNARGANGVIVMLRMINAQISMNYITIAENNPSSKQFEYGWQLNRVTMP